MFFAGKSAAAIKTKSPNARTESARTTSAQLFKTSSTNWRASTKGCWNLLQANPTKCAS
jgi:hypothetical protein